MYDRFYNIYNITKFSIWLGNIGYSITEDKKYHNFFLLNIYCVYFFIPIFFTQIDFYCIDFFKIVCDNVGIFFLLLSRMDKMELYYSLVDDNNNNIPKKRKIYYILNLLSRLFNSYHFITHTAYENTILNFWKKKKTFMISEQ